MEQFGSSFQEVLGWEGSLTHRQYLALESYQRWKLNDRDKLTSYLARIILELRLQNHIALKLPKQVDAEDCFLTFDISPATTPPRKEVPTVVSEDMKKKQMQLSKGMWKAATGIGGT